MNNRRNKEQANEAITVPFLDNFIDFNPEQKHFIANEEKHLLSQFKESIRRDLEQLLNTRYRCKSLPSGLKYAQNSTLNYGIPDLSTLNLINPTSRQQFCHQLASIIRQYEPRFSSVKVVAEELKSTENEEFRFSVEAIVNAEPAPILMVFDSTLELISTQVEVIEADQ